ncbi:hypothetical protein SAMN04488057_10715 [Cyclobacterium lianum]|uniref:Uncharacterized protein n=1 Tax=Cyclobacterium lianum TaxID=388280 RepID=A0A1M7P512_9BACT|nr:hypothetical protein [Cyclobacterium lianum]SHN11593.1 hypothetical protein SAMN04488057_10715 [Cyclobacterium lianum]
MKLMTVICCLIFFSVQVQAQQDLELERQTKDNRFHFQEFEALQFEAVNPEVSTTTFLAKDLSYDKSPTPGPPMGNYGEFKIIVVKLPAAKELKTPADVADSNRNTKAYLVKRDTSP